MFVRPKKYLGQHFLKNPDIAIRIVDSLIMDDGQNNVLEIGPGTGVLTDILVKRNINLIAVEIDKESIEFLQKKYDSTLEIIPGDFLKLEANVFFDTSFSIIGNLPYNISSQIFFKILKMKSLVKTVVCMIQKEVAQRISEPPGSKVYGILSVFLQAFYDIEYLFTVKPGAFHPPPKVDSAVVRFKRNNVSELDCDEALFFRVVKQGFQNRRKTLRNALKPINLPDKISSDPILNRRAETLSVAEYVSLTNKIQNSWSR